MDTTPETKTAPKKSAKRAKKSAPKGAKLHALPPPPPRPESPLSELSGAMAVIVDQLREQSIAQSAHAAASLEVQAKGHGLVYTVRAKAIAGMFYKAIDAAIPRHKHRAELLRLLADEIDSGEPDRKFFLAQHDVRDLLDMLAHLRRNDVLPSLDAPAAEAEAAAAEPAQGLPPDETV